MCFDEDTVGALMDCGMISVRDAVTLEVLLCYLRSLGQLHTTGARKLIFKELGVAGLNGLIWGSVMGLIAYLLYKNIFLGLVITRAMILNLLLAAVVGALIPLFMVKMGRDPAVGSSVLITATADSGGFFIFLGLATLFLV